MRINLSPIHSDPFSVCPLSSVLCAQSYHVVASRASGDAARHGAGLLPIPVVIGLDVSPQTVRGLFLLTNEKYLQLSGLSITCVADYAWTPLRWKLRTRGNLLIHVLMTKVVSVRLAVSLKSQFIFSIVCEVFYLNGARRRHTISLIRRG